jgi:hypothetical protein
VERIKSLVDRYWGLREDVRTLQEDIASLPKVGDPTPQLEQINTKSAWKILTSQTPSTTKDITLSQLEAALRAKWKGTSDVKVDGS